jgi:ketosteroid isomerase-like protein
MKISRILVTALLILDGSAASVSWLGSSSQIVASQASQSAGRKVKVKNGKSVERDKSKPVRRAIEAWYARNIAAFNAQDVAAIMALRTDDFHTRTPDGKVNWRADMEAYTRNLLGRIDHFISQEFLVGDINVQGDLASADVTQKTVRMQRLPDGTLHKVEARAVQTETWKRTADGWKLYTVDNIRSHGLFVDDQPYNPPTR